MTRDNVLLDVFLAISNCQYFDCAIKHNLTLTEYLGKIENHGKKLSSNIMIDTQHIIFETLSI